MKTDALHEDLAREDLVVGPSNRSFGLTFAAVFALLALWKLWHWSAWSALWGAAAFVLLALSLWLPDALALPNKAWLKLGLLLYRVVNPVVMVILFFGTILPIALIMRAVGKDLLRLKWDKAAESYWLPRHDDRPMAESIKQQF